MFFGRYGLIQAHSIGNCLKIGQFMTNRFISPLACVTCTDQLHYVLNLMCHLRG